jgi:hypothetical protein
MTETSYPNREHKNADVAARRRALGVLAAIEEEVASLRRRIEGHRIDGDDTQILTDLTRQVTLHASVLGTLREVREWHAADQAQAAPGGTCPGGC